MLVEIHREDIPSLPHLLNILREIPIKFLLFCDDLSFSNEDDTYKSLKGILEGGIEGRPENVLFHVLEYTDSITQECVLVEESNKYDNKTDVNEITWHFSTKTNKYFDKKTFYVRMYFPSTMNQLLIDSGFNIINQWGNYDRTILSLDSKLQIYDVGINSI